MRGRGGDGAVGHVGVCWRWRSWGRSVKLENLAAAVGGQAASSPLAAVAWWSPTGSRFRWVSEGRGKVWWVGAGLHGEEAQHDVCRRRWRRHR